MHVCISTHIYTYAQVSKQLDGDQAELVNLEGPQEEFQGAVMAGMRVLVAALETRVAGALLAMTRVRWGEMEEMGDDTSAYMTEIVGRLREMLPQLGESLLPCARSRTATHGYTRPPFTRHTRHATRSNTRSPVPPIHPFTRSPLRPRTSAHPSVARTPRAALVPQALRALVLRQARRIARAAPHRLHLPLPAHRRGRRAADADGRGHSEGDAARPNPYPNPNPSRSRSRPHTNTDTNTNPNSNPYPNPNPYPYPNPHQATLLDLPALGQASATGAYTKLVTSEVGIYASMHACACACACACEFPCSTCMCMCMSMCLWTPTVGIHVPRPGLLWLHLLYFPGGQGGADP